VRFEVHGEQRQAVVSTSSVTRLVDGTVESRTKQQPTYAIGVQVLALDEPKHRIVDAILRVMEVLTLRLLRA